LPECNKIYFNVTDYYFVFNKEDYGIDNLVSLLMSGTFHVSAKKLKTKFVVN